MLNHMIFGACVPVNGSMGEKHIYVYINYMHLIKNYNTIFYKEWKRLNL